MHIFVILFSVFCAYSNALYEDQAGKFDWYQQYIGKVENFFIEKQNVPSRRIVVTSKNNLLAALNLYKGNIEWRQHFKEDDIISSVDYCKNQLSTVSSSSDGTLIRLWDTVLGTILWETQISEDQFIKGSIKCDNDSDTLYVVLDDNIYSYRLKNGVMNWNKSLDNVNIKDILYYNILIKSSESVIIIVKYETKYSLNWYNSTGIKFTLPEIPMMKDIDSKNQCIISSPNNIILCIDMSESRIHVLSLNNRSPIWTSANIKLQTKKSQILLMEMLGNDRLMISLSDNSDDNKRLVSIYQLTSVDSIHEFECNLRVALDDVSITSFVELDGKQYLAVLKFYKNKKSKNLEINFVDMKDFNQINHLTEYFMVPKHNGRPINMEPVLFRKKDNVLAYRIFLITVDNSLHFWHQNGNVLWTREESLADVATVEMIDLPVSDTEAKMDEEFGHNEGNIFHKFVKRISTQLSQLKFFLHEQLKQSRSSTSRYYNDKDQVCHHKDDCRSDDDIHTDNVNSNNGSDASNIATTLRRDSFNVHKMLVLASTTGKLFGMESNTGRIVWRYLIDSATSFPENKIQLFVLRTTAHFPHPPQAALLMKCEKSGYPLWFTFNPITGLPQVPEPQILKYRIYQATLLPLPVTEDNSYSKPVLILDKDLKYGEALKVHIFPSTYHLSLDTHPVYIYRVDEKAGFVVGYKIKRHNGGQCSHEKSNDHDCYVAYELWKLNFSAQSQKISSIAFKSSMEQVHSVGRILSDRNVLYKYLNPNTLALMTESKNSSSPNAAVTLYIIDVVIGKIVYSTVHRKASGPVSLVQSENWLIYSFQNLRSHRTEMVVLELYEPYEIPESIIDEFKDVDIEQLKRSMKTSRSDVSSGFDILSILGGERATTKMFSSEQRGKIKSGVDNAINGPLVLKQSYIFSTFIRRAAVSITEKGITSKSIILALESGGIMDLPKTLLDPRRSMMMTQELMEEGIEPYIPEIALRTQSIINYNHSVARTRNIYVGPSGLESTSLVFVYGLDLFFTQIAPSKMFDVLKEDFDYIFIATVTIGMIVGAFVTQRLAARRALYRAWQ